eukprot:2913013-Amphidinium_carterae.1
MPRRTIHDTKWKLLITGSPQLAICACVCVCVLHVIIQYFDCFGGVLEVVLRTDYEDLAHGWSRSAAAAAGGQLTLRLKTSHENAAQLEML